MTEEEKKEYNKKHYEERKEYYKEYQRKHKEEIKKYRHEWYKKNKEKERRTSKKYYGENRERCKKLMKEWRKKYKKEVTKKDKERSHSMVNKGRVFYGYNPYKLAAKYYRLIHPESNIFSPTIANSNMSLETYIAMRAVFDTSTIHTLMMYLYHGKIELEEIEDMISAAGFDMNSEKFIKLMDCINKSKSVYSFYKNYNGEIFS